MAKQSSPGSVTIRDIAAECGLSLSTVSCALADRDNVKPDTKQRVKEAATRLGYFPSHMAKALRTGRTWTIGAVVSDISNPFYADLLRGAQETVAQFGYHLILCSTDYDALKQGNYIDYLIQRRVDGILIAPTSSDSADIATISRHKIPFVMMLRSHNAITTDYIGIDNTTGMRTVMEHLWQLGHRRIALICGRANANPNVERLAAYRAFLAERGIEFVPGYVDHGENTVESGLYASQKMLSLPVPPTAIAAANDLTALGVMKACSQTNVAIPRDLSLVGWDDNFVSALPNIELTTLRVPKWEIGMTAIRLLHRRIETPPSSDAQLEKILFRGELIVRRTTAPPLAA